MNHMQRYRHPLIEDLIRGLDIKPDIRYSLGIDRISIKGAIAKLHDQEQTGISVYSYLPDFQTLGAMITPIPERGWIPIRYCDLARGASDSVFGWVGLVGKTIMVAVADSAIKANLPPHPEDMAQIGRNAFVELVLAAAIAGDVDNIYAPFRSRWWRDDYWANYLMKGLNENLHGFVLWEGHKQVATHGGGKVLTDLEGRTAAQSAETSVEGIFEKSVLRLRRGQWDRRESELPLGLRRKRILGPDGLPKKSHEVEEALIRDTIQKGLELRATGKPWREVAELFAAKGVPMPGTRGGGKTYADHARTVAAAASARTQLRRHLSYYKTGVFTVRRTTRLPTEDLRGIELEFDRTTKRRYVDVVIEGLPWRPFLTDEQWKAFEKIESQDIRSRTTGAAAHDAATSDTVSLLRGVPAWTVGGHEHVIAAETPTAYRWRIDGEIEATLRRTLVHGALGRVFLDQLKSLERPLKPHLLNEQQDKDPLAPLRDRLHQLEATAGTQRAISERADEELMHAQTDNDTSEIEHWRTKGKAARKELHGTEKTLAEVTEQLADAETQIEERTVEIEVDVTEPVLVASILAEAHKRLDPLIAEICEEYGIVRSLRVSRSDTNEQMVNLSTTATVPLRDGTTIDMPLVWEVPDTHDTPGDGALAPIMLRRWAEGAGLEEIAETFPDHQPHVIRRRLNHLLTRGGIRIRGIRSAALKCPIDYPRLIIAARILDEPELAAAYSSELRNQIESAYFGDTAIHKASWADTTKLNEYRRVLAVFESGDGQPINAHALARNASLPQPLIRRMARQGLLRRVGERALAPKPCTRCPGKLTSYLPAPETGSGLICSRCWRAEDLEAVLPEPYLKPFRRTADGDYQIDVPPAVTPAKTQRDRLLTVAEVANQLKISNSGVRQLDGEDQLLPDERGLNGARLYHPQTIDSLSIEKLTRWQQRFGTQTNDEHLSLGEAAAVLDCEPSVINALVESGLLPKADSTVGGHKRFDRSVVESLDRTAIDAYQLPEIGEIATAVGLPRTTLRGLTDKGLVPCHLTPNGSRRYDPNEVKEALNAIGLLGSEDNPIVSIGELAAHPDIPYTTGQLRQLADRGKLPVAGRIGGKRRFRLQDVQDALSMS